MGKKADCEAGRGPCPPGPIVSAIDSAMEWLGSLGGEAAAGAAEGRAWFSDWFGGGPAAIPPANQSCAPAGAAPLSPTEQAMTGHFPPRRNPRNHPKDGNE